MSDKKRQLKDLTFGRPAGPVVLKRFVMTSPNYQWTCPGCCNKNLVCTIGVRFYCSECGEQHIVEIEKF